MTGSRRTGSIGGAARHATSAPSVRTAAALAGPILCAAEHPLPRALLQFATGLARRHDTQLAVLVIARPLPFPASLFLGATKVAIERDRQRALLDEAAALLAPVLEEEPARCGIYAAVGPWNSAVPAHAATIGGELLLVPAESPGGSAAGPPAHDRARRIAGQVDRIILSVVADADQLLRRAVVGVDFGPASEPLVRATTAMLGGDDTELLLVHVTPTESARWSPEWREAYAVAAAAHMATLVEHAVQRGARVRTLSLDGEPAEQLLAVAEAEQCDLLVVGSRGGASAPGLETLVVAPPAALGSVADAVLRGAQRSVAVVPAVESGDGESEASRRSASAGAAIHRILVPLDGSSESERALAVAGDVARRTGARIELVHVRDDLAKGAAVPENYPQVLVDDGQLGRELTMDATTLHGGATETLLAHLAASRTDLVVMTTAGRGGLQRALLGSVADAVVRRAEVPVLLARKRMGPSDASAREPDGRFDRVLLPLDGSALAEEVIPHALAVAGISGVHFLLLRVHPPPITAGRPTGWSLLGRSEAPRDDPYLTAMAARLAGHGALVSIRAPVRSHAADAIVSVAADEGAALVAMTTRGLGGADRMLFGSVASDVIRRAPCAVLIVRPSEPLEPVLHVGAEVRPAAAFT